MNTENVHLGAHSGAHIALPHPARPQAGVDGICARAWFPAGHTGFQGHFPDNPLLPGFLHIELVLDILRENVGDVSLQAVQNAKFLHPIRPDQIININIRFAPDGAIAAELHVAGVAVSSLVLEVSGLPPGLHHKS